MQYTTVVYRLDWKSVLKLQSYLIAPNAQYVNNQCEKLTAQVKQIRCFFHIKPHHVVHEGIKDVHKFQSPKIYTFHTNLMQSSSGQSWW